MDRKSVLYVINHVFLPPRLPQKHDYSQCGVQGLADFVVRALRGFEGQVAEHQKTIVEKAQSLVLSFTKVHHIGNDLVSIQAECLAKKLRELCTNDVGGSILAQISAQNAAMLVNRIGEDVHFELWELTPSNGAVLGNNKGRLVRSFPGHAIAVPAKSLLQDDRIDALVSTLAKMSHQETTLDQPTTTKAKASHREVREPANPVAVTEYLSSILLVLGFPLQVPAVQKNTREEVMYQSGLMPWTRSPTWLLFRIALHLTMQREQALIPAYADGVEAPLYKEFIAYFAAYLLREAHTHDLESDLLSVMTSKLSRRLRKLGDAASKSLRDHGSSVILDTNKMLQKRWSHHCQAAAGKIGISALGALNFYHDTLAFIPELDTYINKVLQLQSTRTVTKFEPTCYLQVLTEGYIPPVNVPSDAYAGLHLANIERWVKNSLGPWLNDNISKLSTCKNIRKLLQDYHAVASVYYLGNPEGTSIMILTCMELWVACNKSAQMICPLLSQYHDATFRTDIVRGLLQSLTLRHRTQFERLHEIEKYLAACSRKSHANVPSIFDSFGAPNSFCVQHFNGSHEQKKLLERIELRATQDRRQKTAELENKRRQYDNLKLQYSTMSCQYRTITTRKGYVKTLHDRQCSKCAIQKEYRELNINVHEWPLPSGSCEAKTVIFELLPPEWFGPWRDTTVFLLMTVLSMAYGSRRQPAEKHRLFDYAGLRRFYSYSPSGRITPLSEVKSFLNSHYRTIKIGAIKRNGDVLVEHALQYKYFDTASGYLTTTLAPTDVMPKRCTFTLPPDTSALQLFLFRPANQPNGPTPNTVIASQHLCPEHLTLAEFKELCGIPLGYRLQWQNILRQLHAPSVDFNKTSTLIFIAQCCAQAGPADPNTHMRAAHSILADPRFSQELLEGLMSAMARSAESWQSSEAFRAFILLATRALSLTSDAPTIRLCLEFLIRARATMLGWATSLRDKARASQQADIRNEFRLRAANCARICALTFDVEGQHLQSMLQSRDAASHFLQCALISWEGAESGAKANSKDTLFWQWQRLGYRCLSVVIGIISSNCAPLDDAISSSWSGHQAQLAWNSVSTRNTEWLIGTRPDTSSPTVHFNLLTGELLVDGRQLNRLPPDYEGHPTYATLFGKSIVDVMPGTVKGFPFATNAPFAGYHVHFALYAAPSELFVRATRDDRVLHCLPSGLFRGFFPDFFIDENVHWYDAESDCVEFRPIDKPWETVHSPWKLTRLVDGPWQLSKDSVHIISLGTLTSKTFAKILAPLEVERRIHCLLSAQHERLDIELPGLESRFYLEADRRAVSCKDFRGMVIDENQSIGTLIGLSNKLVLRGSSKSSDKLVLVPNGAAHASKAAGHVSVQIEKPFHTYVHVYRADRLLGQLVDGGDQSKLFLCHLHALTSFCLPDPFTQRTGTEESLRILRSAAIRSFNGLSEAAIALLKTIAAITPRREFYPSHLRVMQTVHWSNKIGFLAQHDGFLEEVGSLLAQAECSRFFHEDHPKIGQHDLCSFEQTDLLKRNKIRVASCRVASFGAEDYETSGDAPYLARDARTWSSTAKIAYSVARVICDNECRPHFQKTRDLLSHLWQFLSAASILESSGQLENMEIQYDAKWFLSWSVSTRRFVATNWLELHRLLSLPDTERNKCTIMVWLASIACADNADSDVVHVLTTFFTASKQMCTLQLPTTTDGFNLARGRDYQRAEVLRAIKERRRVFDPSTDIVEPRKTLETLEDYHSRGRIAWVGRGDSAALELAKHFGSQWPCLAPVLPTSPLLETAGKYFDLRSIMPHVWRLFRAWYENLQFYVYLGKVCANVSLSTTSLPLPAIPTLSCKLNNTVTTSAAVLVADIFAKPAPALAASSNPSLPNFLAPSTTAYVDRVLTARAHLRKLSCAMQSKAKSPYENDYVANLEASLTALENEQATPRTLSNHSGELGAVLEEYLIACQQNVNDLYHAMVAGLTSQAFDIFQWPRLSPILFLEQLNRANWAILRDDWKNVLIQYGLSLTILQRARRLVNTRGAALIKELQNDGHANWDPSEHPEWLLLEIEGRILVREVQVDIATTMQSPPDNRNSVMQLNMGEGKSSVIVPMLVASLADGKQLMRVLVAKPQSKQMLHMLVSKLGGLINRQVFHLPFSRAIKIGQAELTAIDRLLSRCRNEGGVLLVQPEHILSLQLMGVEHRISEKEQTAKQLLQLHQFMHDYSRDVVDESDENFSPKFELVYSLGIQQPIDHSPSRWTVIQEVLDIVRRCLPATKREFPHGIEVQGGPPGCFPRTRLVDHKAADKFLSTLTDRICDYGTKGFPVTQANKTLRRAIHSYVRETDVADEVIAMVEKPNPVGFWAETTKDTLLLLRGLIAKGILAFAFGHKRWRVDYGLDTGRSPPTRLAIPYRAKDHPSARSEFSHPDVVIVLTSLSYYYQGLTDDQLYNALAHLSQSDQRDDEYAAWVQDANGLPPALRQLGGINLEDSEHCAEKLFPCLRYSKAAVDYFLAHIVFAKEMREFPSRLSASGWDIGEQRPHPSTGFSGTNDAQIVLPLGVTQIPLPAQTHTNALVLQHLLQSENSVELISPVESGKESRNMATNSSTADQLLSMIVAMDPPVRVLLDVGAQIIELDNVGVAKRWLSLLEDNSATEAAVFVDKDDNICVIDRKDRVEPLYTSSYLTQLSLCVVFLDDAHTRGTDLKLPENYRAAVTLGANLVKDRLVQACMRMRELGKGQSVVFCVPEEIHRKISQLQSGQMDAGQPMEVFDVLAWAISETWQDARRNISLWAMQGQRHEDHEQLWAKARGSGEQLEFTETLARQFLEDEAQLVETRYRPRSQSVAAEPALLSKRQRLIHQRCEYLDVTEAGSAILQEEQERELSPEVEEERQVEKPAEAEPLRHSVHPDVALFVQTGIIRPKSKAFKTVYQSLADCSGAKYLAKLRYRAGLLYCTQDFQATIRPHPVGYVSDSYQRPVQWILTSPGRSVKDVGCKNLKHMVIISPYEAQTLMPDILNSDSVALHLYAPLLNFAFRSLDSLDLYTVPQQPVSVEIPRDVILELDLFAGQLYFKSFEEFQALREYLLARPALPQSSSASASSSSNEAGSGTILDENLVALLNIVMTKIRRNCETIDKTHVGKALHSTLLAPEDFEG